MRSRENEEEIHISNMLSKLFFSSVLFCVVISVATQQLINKTQVVEKDLKFKIDTAKLNVIRNDSFALGDIEVLFLSSICYQCSYYKAGQLSSHHTNFTMLVDTRWPLSIKFNSENCNKTVYKHFGERGIYNIILSNNNASNDCKLSKIHTEQEPINSMLPILVAFLVLFGLAIIYAAYEAMKIRIKTKNEKNEDTQPIASAVEENGEEGGLSNAENIAVKTPKAEKRERLKSIDTFRGLCIVVMIFVNLGGGSYYFFNHSFWNGLTVADLVFAWFMFLMGVNIPLSMESLIRRNTPSRIIAYKAIRRTLILFALGIFIINHNTSWSSLRVPGVLQRFSIAYFVAFFVQWSFHITPLQMETKFADRLKGLRPLRDVVCYWPHWLCLIALETLWLCLTFLMPVPGCPTGYIGPGGLADQSAYNESCVGGAAGYIDRWLFGVHHMYGHPTCKNIYYPTYTNEQKVPFDPEGVLGSLNGCVMVLLGCQAGKIFLYYKDPVSRVVRWMGWCLLLGLVSIILCKASPNQGWIPVNKNLWSTTYITTLACMAFFLIAFFYCVQDVFKLWQGRPLDFVGMNSILLYVGHEVFADYVPFSWGLTQHDGHDKWLAMNLLGVTYWVLIAYYCFRIKFFLKI